MSAKKKIDDETPVDGFAYGLPYSHDTLRTADITADPATNPRKKRNAEEDADLYAQIKADGSVREAVDVELTPEGELRLLGGFRRYEGASRAKIPTLPARIFRDLTPVLRIRIGVRGNTGRSDVDVFDRCRAIEESKKAMLAAGGRKPKIANAIAKDLALPDSVVRNALRVAEKVGSDVLDKLQKADAPFRFAIWLAGREDVVKAYNTAVELKSWDEVKIAGKLDGKAPKEGGSAGGGGSGEGGGGSGEGGGGSSEGGSAKDSGEKPPITQEGWEAFTANYQSDETTDDLFFAVSEDVRRKIWHIVRSSPFYSKADKRVELLVLLILRFATEDEDLTTCIDYVRESLTS